MGCMTAHPVGCAVTQPAWQGFQPVHPTKEGASPLCWILPRRNAERRCHMSYDPRHEPQPASPGSGPGEGAAPPPDKKHRSGSGKRQRQKIISVRVYDNERLMIEANAAAVDLCASAFLRLLGTGRQRPHERRRPLPELKPFTQAMGRLGIHTSNAYQLLRLANRGEYPDLEEVRETHRKLNMAADELLAVIRGYSGDR